MIRKTQYKKNNVNKIMKTENNETIKVKKYFTIKNKIKNKLKKSN